MFTSAAAGSSASSSLNGLSPVGAFKPSAKSAFSPLAIARSARKACAQPSESVKVAARQHFERLDGQEGTDSSDLAGRVNVPFDTTLATAISEGQLTGQLRNWLKSQNPGWDDSDLEELDTDNVEDFLYALCEQSIYYSNGPVFECIPQHMIEEMEIFITRQLTMLETLISTIKQPGEQELDEAPDGMGDFPFLSRQKREANRLEAQMQRLSIEIQPELFTWLKSRNWPESEVAELSQVASFYELLEQLICSAIEFEDYEVIQSLPQEEAAAVIEELRTAIQMKKECLDFIDLQNNPRYSSDEEDEEVDGSVGERSPLIEGTGT